jgi:hypothetical protein
MEPFELRELAKEPVELEVGQLRRIEHLIKVVSALDLTPQLRGAARKGRRNLGHEATR